MASNALHPLYPQPAYSGNSLITSQAITVTAGSATVPQFTPGSVGDIQLVTFNVAGDPARVFWEGSTPTASSGHLVVAGQYYTWSANRWNNSKFIFATGSTTCVITASPLNGG